MRSYTSAPINRLEASFYAIQPIKALATHEGRLKKQKMSPNEAKFYKNSVFVRLIVGFLGGNRLSQGDKRP
jgi:hypothetical protein